MYSRISVNSFLLLRVVGDAFAPYDVLPCIIFLRVRFSEQKGEFYRGKSVIIQSYFLFATIYSRRRIVVFNKMI